MFSEYKWFPLKKFSVIIIIFLPGAVWIRKVTDVWGMEETFMTDAALLFLKHVATCKCTLKLFIFVLHPIKYP